MAWAITTAPRRPCRSCAGAWAMWTALRTRTASVSPWATPRSRCIRPGMCLARPRCGSRTPDGYGWPRATTSASPIRAATRSRWCPATPSSPKRPSACRSIAGRTLRRSPPTSWPGGASARRAARRRCCCATRSARRSGSLPNCCHWMTSLRCCMVRSPPVSRSIARPAFPCWRPSRSANRRAVPSSPAS
ncbi:hypothetical protein D3C71_1548200 [compost metagenome]